MKANLECIKLTEGWEKWEENLALVRRNIT